MDSDYDDDQILDDEEGGEDIEDVEDNYDDNDDNLFASQGGEEEGMLEDTDGNFSSMVGVPQRKKFTMLSRKEVLTDVDKKMSELSESLNLSKADAGLVLQEFNWDSTRLLENFYDKSEEYLQKAGVSTNPVKKIPESKKMTCSICYDDYPSDQFFALGCGHAFCVTCWRDYLGHRANNTTAAGMLNTVCMQKDCKLKVNKDLWEKLTMKKDFEKYQYFLLKSYVDSDLRLTFCPNPKCDRLLRFTQDLVSYRPREEAMCQSCGSLFCFACGLESHNPITCKQLQNWRQRNEDDEESLKLIKATTKNCFHCGMATIRNEGCNHMTCRKESGGCGGEWCWLCRGDWKTHGQHTGGFYSCNKYEQSDGKKADDEAATLKARADMFKHYFDRFFNHEVAQKSAEKKKENFQEILNKYREKTARDPKFLGEALDTLIHARHMLKYTYCYGFFMDDLKHTQTKPLFEYQQANAEGITERLADALFVQDVEKMDADKIKSLNTITDKYLKNLINSFVVLGEEEHETKKKNKGSSNNNNSDVKKEEKKEEKEGKKEVDLKKSGTTKKEKKSIIGKIFGGKK